MTADGIDSIDNLRWLSAWYRHCCDGVWEHTQGLTLERYEHAEPPARRLIRRASERAPGWRLTIELAGVPMPRCAPRTLLLDTTDGGWLTCSLTRDRFVGAGDADRVEQIVGVFRRWIEPSRLVSMPARPERMAAHLV